jgi:hypothetical protein
LLLAEFVPERAIVDTAGDDEYVGCTTCAGCSMNVTCVLGARTSDGRVAFARAFFSATKFFAAAVATSALANLAL